MRNLSATMSLWILLCFVIQVSDTQKTKYCDGDKYFCVLCGCFETGLTEHTLSCGENEVIRMQLGIIPIKFIDNDTCITDRNGYCQQGFNDNVETTYAYRVEAYRNCTLQNNCTITVNPVKQGNVQQGNVKLVRYPYFCESNIQDISTPFSEIFSNHVFYFNGIDYISKTVDCYCSLYKSTGNLEVEIFYLHGDNICNRFKILPNTQLVSCTDDAQLYTAPVNIQSKFLKIEIRNMTVTGDEVVFFKVHGRELDVTCSGCIASSGATSTTSMSLTSGHTSASPTEALTTNQNSGQTSLTSTESTTTNLDSIHGSSDPNINKVDFISKADYEEKLKETNAMFGGIIAAIIIVVILGIGIYCLVRKRRKLQKTKQEQLQPVSQQGSGGEYSHYNYVDLDLPTNTDSTHKQPENAKHKQQPPKPKHSGEQSQNSNPQQIGAVQNPKRNENEMNSDVSPNLYFDIEPDAGEESKFTTTDVLQKPEEKKLENKPNEPLYSEPIKNKKPVPKNRKDVNSTPTIVSNTDDLIEDTYNHIGDTNEPSVGRNRVLSESHVKPIAKLKPMRYNHNSTDGVPTVVKLNQNQPDLINPQVKLNHSADGYNHIQIDKANKVPKSIQSNYDHIDDRLVIMDSPVDNTYSHIQDKPKVKTPQPAPRTQPADLPTTDEVYENVELDQELKVDNSVKATSLYNDELEDTYNHLENTNIVKM